MTRKLGTTLAVSVLALLGLTIAHAANTPPAHEPIMIGKDRPVFLGSMTVTAAPLTESDHHS